MTAEIKRLIEAFASTTDYYERNRAYARLAETWWKETGEHLWMRDAMRLAGKR
jgi:hypothetical protein